MASFSVKNRSYPLSIQSKPQVEAQKKGKQISCRAAEELDKKASLEDQALDWLFSKPLTHSLSHTLFLQTTTYNPPKSKDELDYQTLLIRLTTMTTGFQASDILHLVRCLNNSDCPTQKTNAAGALRDLTHDLVNIAQIVDANAIPALVALLEDGLDLGKAYAAAALANLAANNNNNQRKIADDGAIPFLVALLDTGSDIGKEKAAWALGNLAVNNPVNIARIVDANAIPALVALLEDGPDLGKVDAAWALGNLAANNPNNQRKIADAGAIPLLVALLRNGTDIGKADAAEALANLAWNHPNNQRNIADAGAIPLLVALLDTGSDLGKVKAAWALGNLAVNNPSNQGLIVENDDAIRLLVALLDTGSYFGKAQAAWALGNLAANNPNNQRNIADAGAIPLLVALLRNGTDRGKENAAVALGNLAEDNPNNQNLIKDHPRIGIILQVRGEQTVRSIEFLISKLNLEEGWKKKANDKCIKDLREYLAQLKNLLILRGINSAHRSHTSEGNDKDYHLGRLPFDGPGMIINSFLSEYSDAQLHFILKDMKKRIYNDSKVHQWSKIPLSSKRRAFIKSAIEHDCCPYTVVPKYVLNALTTSKRSHSFDKSIASTLPYFMISSILCGVTMPLWVCLLSGNFQVVINLFSSMALSLKRSFSGSE